jgi:hypothetical protein
VPLEGPGWWLTVRSLKPSALACGAPSHGSSDGVPVFQDASWRSHLESGAFRILLRSSRFRESAADTQAWAELAWHARWRAPRRAMSSAHVRGSDLTHAPRSGPDRAEPLPPSLISSNARVGAASLDSMPLDPRVACDESWERAASAVA